MATLADITPDPGTPVVTAVDDTHPAGYFTATTRHLGVTVTYLLRGPEGDPTAPILGRIEYPPAGGRPGDTLAYRGAGLKGGTILRATASTAAFRQMIQATPAL